MLLVGAFALVAVLLAAIGVYGVVAYSVASRTREIGVRVALGAAPRRIVRQVVRGGMALAAVGLAIGLAGAVAVGRLITTLLYGMPPTDPLTLVGAVGLFVLVVLVACWVPRGARRAWIRSSRCGRSERGCGPDPRAVGPAGPARGPGRGSG